MEAYDRILGMDMQAVYAIAAQFVSTAVLIFILYKILYKPMLKFLDARTKRIQDSIAEGQQLITSGKALQAEYEGKLKELDVERGAILEEATKRAKEREAEIIAEAKQAAEKLKVAATLNIEQEKEKTKMQMKSQIIDISALIAQRYVADNINQDTQSRLLDEIITDLGDSTWLN